MKELDAARSFDDTFKLYQVWKPNNRLAGWPDRGVQIGKSRLVWVELKVTTARKDGRILLDNFDQSQAAFMLKWQRADGLCFLLSAVFGQEDELMGYAVIQVSSYSEWTKVRNKLYNLKEITFKESMVDIFDWFNGQFNPQYLDRFRTTKNKSDW
jgi:penicillin-binding protein-related factor A (putative recombinase)